MKAVLAGYFGFANAGDDLLARAAISAIRARIPDVSITLLSSNPRVSSEEFGVSAVPMFRIGSVLRAIASCNRLIFAGGGIFQDHTSWRSLAYYLFLLGAALMLGKQVGLCNVGVDPIRNRHLAALLRRLFEHPRVDGCVRDEASAVALRSAGVRRRFEVTADGVFTLRPSVRQQVNDLLLVVRDSANSSVLQGALLDLAGGSRLRAAVASLQPGRDVILGTRLSRSSGAEDLKALSADAALSQIPASTRVASARFHALVIAAMSGRPFLGIGDPGKIRSLCFALGMPYLSWGADEEEVSKAFTLLQTAAAPDAVSVAALAVAAERGYDLAIGSIRQKASAL